jgi:divalent metal cation (Fe/Co/Zn/Cd) transporter
MAARLAFITSLRLLVAKFGAYYRTDSKAVLAAAIE